jgi:hypothetical protein
MRIQARGRINHDFDAPFPCRVKIDAGDPWKDIDAFRASPEPKEAAGVGEVVRANALERYAELGKRGCEG